MANKAPYPFLTVRFRRLHGCRKWFYKKRGKERERERERERMKEWKSEREGGRDRERGRNQRGNSSHFCFVSDFCFLFFLFYLELIWHSWRREKSASVTLANNLAKQNTNNQTKSSYFDCYDVSFLAPSSGDMTPSSGNLLPLPLLPTLITRRK